MKIQTLIEHAREVYPHFECSRGQADILAAETELKELRSTLHVAAYALGNILLHYGDAMRNSERATYKKQLQDVTATLKTLEG